MAKPRTPLVKAKATGQADKHPDRFKDRKQPIGRPLGKPSRHMDDDQILAFEAFKKEWTWLKESDRALIEVMCIVRAKILTGQEVGVQALSGYCANLARCGGNPSDIQKVVVPDEESEDPTEAYFN